jgi:hypothetical protein
VPDRVIHNSKLAEALLVQIFHKVVSRLVPDHPIDADTPINPYAIGLDPAKWEEDGLFGTSDEPGMSLTQARELFKGFEEVWFESSVEAPA